MIDEQTTPSPGAKAQAEVTEARTGSAPMTANEGTDTERRVIGNPDAPLSAIGDPTGTVTNRVGGTLQREPKPEDLPADAKVAPQGEQVAPNAAPIAVGARPQPEEIAGIPIPEEGEKNPVADSSDPKQFLAPSSDQQDQADLAATTAGASADRLSAGAVPATNPEGKSKEELADESAESKPESKSDKPS